MKISVACAILLLTPTPAKAQDLISGQTLWGGITTGMTKAEAKALHPTMNVRLTDACTASIELIFQKKVVSAVKLIRHRTSTSRSCASVMLASLKQKYGEPRSDVNQTQYVDRSCYGEISCALVGLASVADPDPNKYQQAVTWFTGDMLVEFNRDRETDIWHITYYQARVSKPDAASKL